MHFWHHRHSGEKKGHDTNIPRRSSVLLVCIFHLEMWTDAVSLSCFMLKGDYSPITSLKAFSKGALYTRFLVKHIYLFILKEGDHCSKKKKSTLSYLLTDKMFENVRASVVKKVGPETHNNQHTTVFNFIHQNLIFSFVFFNHNNILYNIQNQHHLLQSFTLLGSRL